MNNFPVTDSTLSAKHLGAFIKEEYNFDKELACKIFRTGINDSYIITTGTGQRFVFRVYCFNWRSEVEISEEIRFLTNLKENGISVSYPIPDAKGGYIQKLPAPEGLRYGMLFSYAKGEKVRHLTEKTCFNIGVLMAKLHQVSQKLHLQRVDYNADSLLLQPYQHALAHFPEANEEMLFIKQAGKEISNVFSNVNNDELRTGAVHLDIWYDNMHINSESDMTIFDFDFCGNGWLVHDIAYFIHHLFHIEPDKSVYESKRDAFISGYESITEITSEEKRLIPYSAVSLWVFYLGVQSQRFDNWSNVFLSENFLKMFMGRSKEWLKYHEIEIGVSDLK